MWLFVLMEQTKKKKKVLVDQIDRAAAPPHGIILFLLYCSTPSSWLRVQEACILSSQRPVLSEYPLYLTKEPQTFQN